MGNKLKIYYRISDGSYKKNRLENASKENCYKNFIDVFKNYEITVLIDGDLKFDIKNYIKLSNISFENIKEGSGAQSFRYMYLKAINENNDNDFIYFVEDDYFHLENADKILLEGLNRANYVTLYDHPDKYINKVNGGNPFVENGGEITRVILTESSHWKLTNSTTMTFASKVKVLKEDNDIWFKYTEGTYPRDFEAFIELRNKGRSLISSIPGYSTHTEKEWLTPLVNWNNF